jgi:predicted hydrocarbon binding protein
LLAATLHQGILDVLPQRIDFYEHFLSSDGLRDGSIGPAPMLAVLGFLRTEGDAYGPVVTRAGRLAAEWTVASMPPIQRRTILMLPRPLRARAAMRVAARIVRLVSSGSRASTEVRKSTARLSVKASPFCAVRERQTIPLCGFYAAVAAETLTRLGVPALAHVERCRAVDGASCVIALELSGAGAAADPAMAA